MILVAIPVYERAFEVSLCFATAAELALPEGGEIVIFDDASPTLDVPALMAASGLAARYERSPQRLGADGMTRHIWQMFLAGPHQKLLILDSDMIANRDAVLTGLALSVGSPGLLSLYNSASHKATSHDGDLVAKQSVGNAGTLWSRQLVSLALTVEDERREGLDHAYCRALRSRGVPIHATVRSRLQHIGLRGENNRYFGGLDHGLGFVPDSPAQWDALARTYDALMSRQAEFVPPVPRLFGRATLKRLLRGFRRP